MPHDNVDLRATARLPGLDIEIVHRRSSNRDREEIYLNLAVPASSRSVAFCRRLIHFYFGPRSASCSGSRLLA